VSTKPGELQLLEVKGRSAVEPQGWQVPSEFTQFLFFFLRKGMRQWIKLTQRLLQRSNALQRLIPAALPE
jgi:hypothetical protein